MGKGDKRSRKGKVWKGSYGNSRRKKKGHKPAFIPKPKPKKVLVPVATTIADAPIIEAVNANTEATAPKAAKPKKAAVTKKPKVEGEKKAATKKEPKKKATKK